MGMNGDGLHDAPSGHDAYGHSDFTGPGQATYDALAVAHSHDTGHSHVSMGTMSGGPHFEGHHSQDVSSAGPDEISQRTKNTGDRRFYQVHVTAHGKAEVMNAFAKIAEKYDVIRLDLTRPSLNSYRQDFEELADAQPWNPPYNIEKDPPEGYYSGATGSTKLELQIWQVGVRPDAWDSFSAWVFESLGWKRLKSTPVYDSKARTYFEVRCATLKYDQTKDFETYFSIYITSQKVWHRYFSDYAFLKIPLERHRIAAEKMIHEVLDVLKKAEPSEFSRSKRRELSAGQVAVEPLPDNSAQNVLTKTCEEPSIAAPVESSGNGAQELDRPQLQTVDITVTIPRL